MLAPPAIQNTLQRSGLSSTEPIPDSTNKKLAFHELFERSSLRPTTHEFFKATQALRERMIARTRPREDAVSFLHYLIGVSQLGVSRSSHMPVALRNLASVIKSSRTILALANNWDGEGARAIQESTWERAVRFIWTNGFLLSKLYSLPIGTPEIVPAADGSIDIDWKTSGRELLINIPPGPGERASYYGDDLGHGTSIEGNLDTTSQNCWLLAWLTE